MFVQWWKEISEREKLKLPEKERKRSIVGWENENNEFTPKKQWKLNDKLRVATPPSEKNTMKKFLLFKYPTNWQTRKIVCERGVNESAENDDDKLMNSYRHTITLTRQTMNWFSMKYKLNRRNTPKRTLQKKEREREKTYREYGMTKCWNEEWRKDKIKI